MPPHGPEVAIAKFLRDALAGNEVGVTNLEAMARGAGLLGENQRITNAKLFRAAKKTLGITSRRAGFGAGSRWLWRLPPQNETSAQRERGSERSAAREPRVPIPTDWVEGVASLDDRDPPSDVPRHRWRLFVDDCKRFVASDWAGRAAQLGWNAMSLFGCAPKRPLETQRENGFGTFRRKRSVEIGAGEISDDSTTAAATDISSRSCPGNFQAWPKRRAGGDFSEDGRGSSEFCSETRARF
jgi:hypothetical protein